MQTPWLFYRKRNGEIKWNLMPEADSFRTWSRIWSVCLANTRAGRDWEPQTSAADCVNKAENTHDSWPWPPALLSLVLSFCAPRVVVNSAPVFGRQEIKEFRWKYRFLQKETDRLGFSWRVQLGCLHTHIKCVAADGAQIERETPFSQK